MHGTVQGTKKKWGDGHTAISSYSSHVLIQQRSWECLLGWHFPGFLSEAVKEQNEIHRAQLTCEALPLCELAHVLFPSNLSITSKLEGYNRKYWARMKPIV